jgi:hypothetical protein
LAEAFAASEPACSFGGIPLATFVVEDKAQQGPLEPLLGVYTTCRVYTDVLHRR